MISLLAQMLGDSIWVAWAIAIVIVLPVVMIALDELAESLTNRRSALAGPILFLRNVVLPALAFFILLTRILNLPPDNTLVRIVITIVGIVVIFSALQLLNAVLFTDTAPTAKIISATGRFVAVPASWRSRVPPIGRDLLRFLIVGIGCAIVLSRVWNLDVGGLFTALGVSTIVLGLALQEPLGNIFSGIVLLMQRPFDVGDTIRADGNIAEVKEMTWRAAIVQTAQNEVREIPHSILAKQVVGNFSRAETYSVEPIPLAFPASLPPNLVRQNLKELCVKTPGVLHDPAPSAVVAGISGSTINYTVTFSVDSYAELATTRQTFLTRLWYATRRKRFGLPPLGAADATALAYPREAVRQRIDQVSLLSRLAPEVKDQLAGCADIEIYGQGENLMVEGTLASGVFIVLDGSVCLSVKPINFPAITIECLDKGGLIGDPNPGAICFTTAEAHTDAEVLLLNHDALNLILKHDPHLLRQIAQTVESMRKGAEAARHLAENKNPSRDSWDDSPNKES